MTLEPDAQAFVERMAAAPGPLHTFGVEGAQEAVRLIALNPPPQQVFSVQDWEIPEPAGPILLLSIGQSLYHVRGAPILC